MLQGSLKRVFSFPVVAGGERVLNAHRRYGGARSKPQGHDAVETQEALYNAQRNNGPRNCKTHTHTDTKTKIHTHTCARTHTRTHMHAHTNTHVDIVANGRATMFSRWTESTRYISPNQQTKGCSRWSTTYTSRQDHRRRSTRENNVGFPGIFIHIWLITQSPILQR